MTQQEALNRSEKNKNKHPNKIAEFFVDMNLGFLTVWGLVIATVAGFAINNLWLFGILIGASAVSNAIVGKVSETRIINKINSGNNELKTKVTDLQARIDRLKEHFGINDEF